MLFWFKIISELRKKIREMESKHLLFYWAEQKKLSVLSACTDAATVASHFLSQSHLAFLNYV